MALDYISPPGGYALEAGRHINAFANDQLMNRMQELKNKEAEVKLPFTLPMAQAELKKNQIENELKGKDLSYYDRKALADLAYKNALTGHTGALTKEINTLLPAHLQELNLKNQFTPMEKTSEARARNANAAETEFKNKHHGYWAGPEGAQYELLKEQEQAKNQNALRDLQNKAASPVQNPMAMQQQPNIPQVNPLATPQMQGAMGQQGMQGNIQNAFNAVQQSPQAQIEAPLNNLATNIVQQVEQKPETPSTAEEYLKGMTNTNLHIKQARLESMLSKKNGRSFLSLPSDQKKLLLDQGSGFGLTPDETAKRLIQGQSMDDIAEEKGYGRDHGEWPDPISPPTTATNTRNQRALSAQAGINAIEPITTKWASNYKGGIHNISPALIKDISLRQNKEKVAEFLAAYAANIELTGARINSVGGTVGIGAINKLMKGSEAEINKLELNPDAETYRLMQKKLREIINRMGLAERRATVKQYEANEKARLMAGSNETYGSLPGEGVDKTVTREEKVKEKGNKHWVYNPETGKVEAK